MDCSYYVAIINSFWLVPSHNPIHQAEDPGIIPTEAWQIPILTSHNIRDYSLNIDCTVKKVLRISYAIISYHHFKMLFRIHSTSKICPYHVSLNLVY